MKEISVKIPREWEFQMDNNCRFCEIIAGKFTHEGIDEPFAENDQFVALASIGAIIEGWSLIVPKDHRLSMRDLFSRQSFAEFTTSVMAPLERIYGPLVAFEHGANKEGSATACGTDHAHLHLVPSKESFLADMHSSGLVWTQCETSKVAQLSMGNEYLFYADLDCNDSWVDPVGYLHVLNKPISQYFRHLIASREGAVNTADYRRFPYVDRAQKTRRTVIGEMASGEQ
jgi:diadenosine tetraphosphate (Ap4A) HIT family hydrolase